MIKRCSRCNTQAPQEVIICPRCRGELTVTFEPGDALGDYQVLEVLPEGAGGMARLYRCRRAGSRRDVVLKVANRGTVALQALVREADILSQLRHRDIVRIYPVRYAANGRPVFVDQVTVGGLQVHFIVLEYLGGISLRERLGRAGSMGQPLSRAEVRRIAKQVGAALAFAHSQGVIHLDVKPANIVLTSSGRRVVLTDFGIAQPADPNLRQPSGWSAGTARYMSPEQVTGTLADHRSDIFSLAVVVYEMLTGHPAFPGSTAREAITAVLRQAPPAPSTVRPGLPPALDPVFARALDKDKRIRYDSVEEFLADLNRALPTRRDLLPRLAVGLGMAALFVALAWFLIQPGKRGSQPVVMVLSTPTSSQMAPRPGSSPVPTRGNQPRPTPWPTATLRGALAVTPTPSYAPPTSTLAPLPPSPTPTATAPVVTPAPELSPGSVMIEVNCPNPNARMTRVRVDDGGRRVIVYGDAAIPNFQFYKLEYRAPDESTWHSTSEIRPTSVRGDVLETWEVPTVLSPGTYLLKLTVVDNTSREVERCTTEVPLGSTSPP